MKFLLMFCLVPLCGIAQTRVCSGDSVVLALNGYKQGNVLWQQSTDRTSWSDAQGTTHNDSLVITAVTTLYYRAKVTDGSCSPYYSDTTWVIVNPPRPTAIAASGVTSTSFVAKWNSVSSPGDTVHYTYYLDVSTVPTFASFVSGYNDFLVTDTTYSIDLMDCDTNYYYRVRTHDHCGASANSNTIAVRTDTCPRPFYCRYKRTCSGNITDSRDNKTYKTVQIGSQCWMAQNLNVGTAIPGVVYQTNNTILEKYCYGYGGATTDTVKVGTDSGKCATYGGLYMWDEMMAYGQSVPEGKGPQGICPAGWHLPTDEEWKCLETTLGMSEAQADLMDYRGTIEGNKLKTKGNGVPPLWASPSTGTDTSHFSALPSGFRYDAGVFLDVGNSGNFWTATEHDDATTAWSRKLYYSSAQVYRQNADKISSSFSVRCVKD